MKQKTLGVDIGGSKIRIALLAGRRVEYLAEEHTPGERRAFLKTLRTLLAHCVSYGRIGVGIPGMVDRVRGIVIKAPNLPFLDGWNAKSFFRACSGKTVLIDNDSRCFMRAEWKMGAARGVMNAVGVTIGTGIGGGIVANGSLLFGAHGSAGELGHTIIGVGMREATFEELAGAHAYLRGKNVLLARMRGIGVANCINVFDPDIVVLGGGGVFANDAGFREIIAHARTFIVAPAARRTPIVRGMLGESAQAIGAALLFEDVRSYHKPDVCLFSQKTSLVI